MSSANHRFCAVESIRAGDPLAGTATHAAKNLLISWPRSKWSRSLRVAKDMDEGLAGQIDQLAAGGRRVNLIDRRDWPADIHRVYLFPEGQYFDIPRHKLGEFLVALESDQALSSWTDLLVEKPLILCCTHGKKDKCCAKFGYAAYRELAMTARQENLPFEVWESSHLGGCRLAASVMVFPSMRKYGRVASAHVLPLLQHELEDTAYLPCYRGQGLLTPAQQCAEAAAIAWLSERGIRANISVTPERPSRNTNEVRVSANWKSTGSAGRVDGMDSGALVVQCGTVEVLRLDTCADLEEGPTPSQCWVAKDIRPQ